MKDSSPLDGINHTTRARIGTKRATALRDVAHAYGCGASQLGVQLPRAEPFLPIQVPRKGVLRVSEVHDVSSNTKRKYIRVEPTRMHKRKRKGGPLRLWRQPRMRKRKRKGWHLRRSRMRKRKRKRKRKG